EPRQYRLCGPDADECERRRTLRRWAELLPGPALWREDYIRPPLAFWACGGLDGEGTPDADVRESRRRGIGVQTPGRRDTRPADRAILERHEVEDDIAGERHTAIFSNFWASDLEPVWVTRRLIVSATPSPSSPRTIGRAWYSAAPTSPSRSSRVNVQERWR